MKITNLQLNNYYLADHVQQLPEQTLREMLRTANINFVLTEISRLASMLLCELKASYVQQSQRYVTLNEHGFDVPNQLSETDRGQSARLLEKSYRLYAAMSEKKDKAGKGRPQITDYKHAIPIEDARYILPLACKTNLSIAMSGDKLIDLYKIFTDKRYSSVFSEIKQQLDQQLPGNLVAILNKIALSNSKDSSFDEQSLATITEYYAPLLSQLNEQRKVVLLSDIKQLKKELDLRVGLGALTSTQAKTPAQVLSEWGVEAQTKAQAVTSRVLGYGHESIAEMARTTFAMMFSLVTYHQLERHRLPQMWREAIATLVYNIDRAPVVPSSILISPFAQEFQDLLAEFRKFRIKIAGQYGDSVAANYLLNCEQVQVVVASNARSDSKMLAERTCMNAQWEIRQLALAKLKLLEKLSAVLYSKARPACVVYGKCPEGALACGQQIQVKKLFEEY